MSAVLAPSEVVWRPLQGSQSLALDTRAHDTLYEGTRGPGKDIALDTPVLTQRGWLAAGNVTAWDKLVALDGSYTEILGIYPKYNREMYKVEFYDTFVIADAEHNWLVQDNDQCKARKKWHVRTTKQLADSVNRFSVPYLQGAIPGEQWSGPDAYMIGLMLGDGTMGSARVTLYSADDWIINYAVANHGWRRYKYEGQIARVCCPEADASKWRELMPRVTAGFKAVPVGLLNADPASRLAVLQGLMDSDGSIEANGKMRFVSLSADLAKNVHDLVWSLGGCSTIYWEDRPSRLGGVNGRWRVSLRANNKFNPFRLPRKANRLGEQKKFLTRGIKSITRVDNADGVCFSIAHESKCFVIKDYVITHNTVAQLMRYRRRVGLGYGSFWRGIIFDREFKNLDDVVAQSKRFYKRFNDGGEFLSSAQQYKWVWPTGEELLFRHVKSIDDYDDFHGHEYPFIGWNELTKQPTSELYDKLMSTNRSSFIPEEHTPRDKTGKYLTSDGKPLPSIPLETFSTTNPNGPGHNWVKRRFISIAPSGTVVRKEVPIFNPQTQQDEIFIRKQVSIFGSYRENRYLDPKYVAELNSITDPNLRKAWLGGDWDVMSGGAIDDLWRNQVHIKQRFKVPKDWLIDRSFDWGSTHPFSVGWWAEANGEEVELPNGDIFAPAPGSLIQIAEWYGTIEIGSNKGLKIGAPDVADGIKKKEIALMENGWIKMQPQPGPADNQIRDVRERDVDTIEKKMADKGICWTHSDKSPGSRRNGLQLIRDRLQASLTGEGPGLYFMSNCEASTETIPALPRDSDKPDDIDTTAEDHCYDMVRYRILSGNNRLATELNVQFRR